MFNKIFYDSVWYKFLHEFKLKILPSRFPCVNNRVNNQYACDAYIPL